MAEQRTTFTPPTGGVGLEDSFINKMGLQRPRTGQPGVTRAGGVGGAGLAPATPAVVNPPGVPSAPVGRPPAPAPGPTPGAPAIPSPAPAAPAPAAAPASPAAGPATPAAVPGVGQQTDFTGRVFQAARMQFNKMPSRSELVGVDPSVAIDTPYGQMVTDPNTGQRELVFTPEGKQLYAQEKVRLEKAFGPSPVAGMPGAPPPPVEPGKLAYNPFSPVGWVR